MMKWVKWVKWPIFGLAREKGRCRKRSGKSPMGHSGLLDAGTAVPGPSATNEGVNLIQMALLTKRVKSPISTLSWCRCSKNFLGNTKSSIVWPNAFNKLYANHDPPMLRLTQMQCRKKSSRRFHIQPSYHGPCPVVLNHRPYYSHPHELLAARAMASSHAVNLPRGLELRCP